MNEGGFLIPFLEAYMALCVAVVAGSLVVSVFQGESRIGFGSPITLTRKPGEEEKEKEKEKEQEKKNKIQPPSSWKLAPTLAMAIFGWRFVGQRLGFVKIHKHISSSPLKM